MLQSLLTPRQVAALLGVSESTVRRWCDAGLVETTKTAGGHRRIARQALLRFAREQGLDLLDTAPLATAGRGGRLADSRELSDRFYRELVNGEERGVQQFTRGLIDRTGDGAAICDDIIAPVMHRVGEEWDRDELAIFREHAATQRALAAIAVARSQLAAPRRDAPPAVCAALPGDPYSLAPAMCSLVMQAAGFRTALLGPNTPVAEILQAAVELSAQVITVSVSTAPADSEDLVLLCDGANERGIRIALGGRMLSPELRKKLRPDFFGDTMAHLSSYAGRAMDDLRRADRAGNGS